MGKNSGKIAEDSGRMKIARYNEKYYKEFDTENRYPNYLRKENLYRRE